MRLDQYLAIGFPFTLCVILLGVAIPRARAEAIAPALISTDTEWTLADSPYEIDTPLVVSAGATLTIDPGVVVKSVASNGVAALNIRGTLVAGNDSDAAEVVFTSVADDAYGGDSNADGMSTSPEDNRWGAIQFEGSAATSTLEHVRFRYGGVSGDTQSATISVQGENSEGSDGQTLFGSRVLISDGVFEPAPGYQLYAGGQSFTDFERDDFQGQKYIARLHTAMSDTLPTTVLMHDSSMTDLASGAAFDFQNGVFVLQLENNWWGTPFGPLGSDPNRGGQVSVGYDGDVSYAPFLACDPFSGAACAAPAPPLPKVSSVLFLPGTQGSRLYYRDLLGVEHQVWEPDLFTDIPYLAMNTDGTSKFDLYTKDIIDSTYANDPLERAAVEHINSGALLDVYGGFETYLDSLVASSTFGMREWRAYPYDWRYDVRDVVANGTPTEESDGSVHLVLLADVVRHMAANSATGKVTIIGHSNGGLLAKAFTAALGPAAADIIDQIILVGTPQWGTPSAIGALLHGDNFASMPRLVMHVTTAREVEDDMPNPYDLLPSAAYFAHIASPVATFEPVGSISGIFATAFGSALTSFSGLAAFLKDVNVLGATVGDADDLRTPAELSSELIDAAAVTHAVLDNWTSPSDVRVTAIAGWGQQTTSGLRYTTASKAVCTSVGLFTNACVDAPTLRHDPMLTQDGDGTVVSASAAADTSAAFYFDAAQFRNDKKENIAHSNLTSAEPIQSLASDLLQGIAPLMSAYISTSKPTAGSSPLIVVSSHSPVNLAVTDALGNISGVVPIAGTDFATTLEQIPGSSVQVFGDEDYIYLPLGNAYRAVATGYATGTAAVELGTVSSDGTIMATQSFSQVPVAPGTLLSFSVNGATASPLGIDENGDGSPDSTLGDGSPTSSEYRPPAAQSQSASASGSDTHSGGSISIPQSISSTTPSFSSFVATSSQQQAIDSSAPAVVMPQNGSATISLIRTRKSPISVTNTSQAAAATLASNGQGSASLATALEHWSSSVWTSLSRVFARLHHAVR